MRILVLNWRDWGHPRAGGAEEDLHQFCSRAARDGHQVDVYCGGFGHATGSVSLDGCTINRVGNSLSVYCRVAWELARGQRRREWDVIIDDINGVPFFSPLYRAEPVVAIFHHAVGRTFFQEVPFPLPLVGLSAERLVPSAYRRAVITVRSLRIKQELIRRGAEASRVRVIPSGIDHSAFSPRSAKSAAPKLLFVGPVKRYKHPEIALEALSRLLRFNASSSLDIIGWSTREMRQNVMHTARLLGVADHVNFMGFVTDKEKAVLMSRAWVLLLPSEREGWSLAAVESGACGTPTVAFDVGGLVDSVRDGESGLLVPFGNREGFEDAVLRIITDETLRTKLERGALRWTQQFSWDRYYGDMMSALRNAPLF